MIVEGGGGGSSLPTNSTVRIFQSIHTQTQIFNKIEIDIRPTCRCIYTSSLSQVTHSLIHTLIHTLKLT